MFDIVRCWGSGGGDSSRVGASSGGGHDLLCEARVQIKERVPRSSSTDEASSSRGDTIGAMYEKWCIASPDAIWRVRSEEESERD